MIKVPVMLMFVKPDTARKHNIRNVIAYGYVFVSEKQYELLKRGKVLKRGIYYIGLLI